MQTVLSCVPMLCLCWDMLGDFGPMLGLCWGMLGPFWAMLTQIWQLSRWFYVTLKKRGKTRDSRAKMLPQTKAIAIAYGSRVPRKNASAPSVAGRFRKVDGLVVSVFNEIHCSQQPSPGRMVHQQSCNDGLLGIFDRVLSSYPYPERGSLLGVGILRLKKCWPININHRLHRKHAIPTVGIASQHFALLFQSYASLAALAASSWASATRWPSLTTLRLQGSSEQRAVHRCWSSALLLMWESRGKPTMNHPEFSKKQMVYTQFAVLFGTEIQSL